MDTNLNKFKSLLLIGLLFFSFSLSAQKKRELKEQIGRLQEVINTANVKISNLEFDNAELEKEVKMLKVDNRSKQIIIDSLKTVNLNMQYSLQEEKESNGNEGGTANTDGRIKNIPVPKAVAELKEIYKKVTAKNRARATRLYDEMQLDNCLRLKTFQAMFYEEIRLEYNLTDKGTKFNGILKHRYSPDFGEQEFKLQMVSGTFKKQDDVIILTITQVGDKPIRIIVNFHKSRDSQRFIKGDLLDIDEVYTHHVPIDRFELSICR